MSDSNPKPVATNWIGGTPLWGKVPAVKLSLVQPAEAPKPKTCWVAPKEAVAKVELPPVKREAVAFEVLGRAVMREVFPEADAARIEDLVWRLKEFITVHRMPVRKQRQLAADLQALTAKHGGLTRGRTLDELVIRFRTAQLDATTYQLEPPKPVKFLEHARRRDSALKQCAGTVEECLAEVERAEAALEAAETDLERARASEVYTACRAKMMEVSKRIENA